MTLWAVVPTKPLAVAKSRLAPLLTPAERQALAAALLADVVGALLGASLVARVLVVSPDPAALALAETLGAMPLPEPPDLDSPALAVELHSGNGGTSPTTPAEAGLNAALDYAAEVASTGGVAGLLALPADLPLATAADVMAVVAAPPAAPAVVLAPTSDGGTGALLRWPPLGMPARFGPSSVEAHLEAAAARGVAARLVWRPNLSLDIDRPADLLRLAALPPRSRTQALLAEWRVAERVGAWSALERREPVGERG